MDYLLIQVLNGVQLGLLMFLLAAGLTLTFFTVETLSGLAATARVWHTNGFGARLAGRLQALFRIATS